MATAKKTTASKPGRQPQDRKPKQQTPAASNGQAEFEIAWSFEGRGYRITPKDLTAVESRLYRQQMGQPFMRTMADGDIDLDVIATLMWLMDRRDDPLLDWEDVAERITYANISELDVGAADPSS